MATKEEMLESLKQGVVDYQEDDVKCWAPGCTG